MSLEYGHPSGFDLHEAQSCIGHTTHYIRDGATDLAGIWTNAPWRRREFDAQEIADLREAHLKLGLLLSAIDVTPQRNAA